MSKSSLNDIQKALYVKLTADTTLMSMISGIFDYVPDNKPFPQVIIGEFIENRWNVFGRSGKDVLASIHIYSDKNGNKEAFTILNRLNEILDNTTLTITNHSLVSIQFEDNTVWNAIPSDSNPKEIREVIARYRILVQEN